MNQEDYIEKDKKLNIKQKIEIYCLLIIIGGIFGFVYEYIFYYFNGGMKNFYWRGGNFLPWINIYALGAILIYKLFYKDRKSPLKVFIKATLLCGILEFISGAILYKLTGGQRFWDYNTEILNFGNIYGFICLRSVLFFGISGLILIYLIVPTCYLLISKFKGKVFFYLIIIICSIFVLDEFYNSILAKIIDTKTATEIYKNNGLYFMKF